MLAGKQVVDVVLGQHNLADPGKVLRFILAQPKDLRRGEAGKGDVGRQGGQALLADDVVEIVDLLGSAAVVPENGGADYPILAVQNDQAVHLAAAADTGYLLGVKSLQQRGDPLKHCLFPIFGRLLAPAGLGKLQRIVPGYYVFNVAVLVHQQQLDRRGAEIDADIQAHANPSYDNLYAQYSNFARISL